MKKRWIVVVAAVALVLGIILAPRPTVDERKTPPSSRAIEERTGVPTEPVRPAPPERRAENTAPMPGADEIEEPTPREDAAVQPPIADLATRLSTGWAAVARVVSSHAESEPRLATLANDVDALVQDLEAAQRAPDSADWPSLEARQRQLLSEVRQSIPDEPRIGKTLDHIERQLAEAPTSF